MVMDSKSLKDIENSIVIAEASDGSLKNSETEASHSNYEKEVHFLPTKIFREMSSSSSSSVYSTAEEDLDLEVPPISDEDDELQQTLQVEKKSQEIQTMTPKPSQPIMLSLPKKDVNVEKQPIRKTKSCGPSVSSDVVINNQRLSPNNANNISKPSGSKSNLLELEGAEINQLQATNPKGVSVSTTTDDEDDDDDFKSLDSSLGSWSPDGCSITVRELQKVFDCFKLHDTSRVDCERLLDILGTSQNRNDFQWALHQLGGFNALLFLYARIVELCRDDEVQSKGLSLALGQIKNHSKITDVPPSSHYNLIRFVLKNDKSAFGFKTFIILVHHCLTPSGNKLLDYELLETCLLASWRTLIKVRCTDAEAPTGRRSLFECLLTVILDLLLEKNVYRSLNIALFKSKNFAERLLSICCNMIFECASESAEGKEMQTSSASSTSSVGSNDNIPSSSSSSSSSYSHNRHFSPLSSIDALRICALVKSILSELMSPPDAYVTISVVKFGLYPLLPKELPPLPRREDAFFLYHTKAPKSASEAEESLENFNESRESPSSTISSKHYRPNNQESLSNVILMNEDIPELIGGSITTNQKVYNKETFEKSQYDGFGDNIRDKIFQESLIEALMSVLLNTLAILPDGAFFSILKPHLNAHLFIAYCSHPNLNIKSLALKLISSYLSRVKNPCITEFLKNKGFFLLSLFTQDELSELAPVVVSICQGFGPVSYPLATGLLHSNTMLTSILQWIQDDAVGVIPALMSVGFIPSILNAYQTSASLPRPLNAILSHVIRYNVLNPKDDPWKALFCPALESVTIGCPLTGRFYQEAITVLKSYTGKEIKRADSNQRLLWLCERSVASRFSNNFDKWLLQLLISHVMELDGTNKDNETEVWKHFVNKSKKRLYYLMGVLLSKIFLPHKGDFELKQQTLRLLLQTCPNLNNWLPKVLKCDVAVERCFTAFLRIFLCEASQKEYHVFENGNNAIKNQSFQTLLAEGNRLSLQLLQPNNNMTPPPITITLSQPETNPEAIESFTEQSITKNLEADKAIREKFENILVDAGILSPTNNFSTFSSDFRKFKILLETPPMCGVSFLELRNCIITLDKIRANLTICHSLRNVHQYNETRSKLNLSSMKGYFCNAQHFENIYGITSKYATEVVEFVTRMKTQMGIEIIKSVCTREADQGARSRWWALTEQLGHPKAPWHFPDLYPKFWALDQSEGPSRIRIRLQREHLKIHNRFVLPKFRGPDPSCQKHLLDYLFKSENEYDEVIMAFPSIKSEIQYMRFCTRVVTGEEICGEIILSVDSLYFIPEWNKNSSVRHEHVEVPLTSIVQLLRRRYTLEEKAVEVFVDSQSYLFVFRNFKDREEFIRFIPIKQGPVQGKNSIVIMDATLNTVTNRWIKGHISNFDYLTYLNTAAGRTFCDLMQYPVFPFVLAKYDSPTLDLTYSGSYRELKRPMAIQDPSKQEHFLATYNYLKRECDSAPFHYGSHYSNSGIVLHYLIRLPPFTQHFLKYQDGSFDIPDRSFHSVETTWRLAARESNTDFKEAIPEMYYLPEMLQNLQHFDLGVRQNGKRVDDVDLPQWAKGNPRLFTLINRQALESNHVRKHLSDWIDLVFGYKQTGKAAISAINVFHPSTYEGFDVEGVGDELLRKARRAMVSTYGQTPKQLFTAPHLRSMAIALENCPMEVINTTWGIRWGYFIGSPTCSELEVVNTREYSDEMALFETQTRILFWPKHTLIMGDTVVGSWSANEIQIKSKIIHICIGDEITVCSATSNCIWLGHQSGKISVLKISQNLDKIVQTCELVGHYKPIKCIDLNVEFSLAISCAGENYALLWDMNKISYSNLVQRNTSVDSVSSSRSTGDISLVSFSSNCVTLTTINGFEVGTISPEEKIESACISGMDCGRNVNLLAVGCDYGYIRFYSTWDLKFVNEIKVVPLASLSIQSIRYSNDGRRLYCLSINEEVSITAALQLPDTSK